MKFILFYFLRDKSWIFGQIENRKLFCSPIAIFAKVVFGHGSASNETLGKFKIQLSLNAATLRRFCLSMCKPERRDAIVYHVAMLESLLRDISLVTSRRVFSSLNSSNRWAIKEVRLIDFDYVTEAHYPALL